MEGIVAEVGQNFVGDICIAQKLIAEAHANGACAVKFQLFDTDALYQEGTKNYELAKESELSFVQAEELFLFGHKVGIEVFFSVFDSLRVGWCEKIGVKRYKIAKRSNQDVPIINACVDTNKPTIISYSQMPPNYRNYGVQALYCVGKYPTARQDLHFNQVNFYEEFQGYSDHSIGIEACKVAISRGATLIEKHFCLTHKTGVDAPWSMDFGELAELSTFYHQAREML